MIIQTTGTNQAVSAGRRVSDDSPKVVGGPPQQAPSPEPSSLQVQSAVGAINHAMQLSNRNLKFSVDPETKQPVVQVVDTETGDLIRQIPSREALAIASSIDEFLQRGVLLKQKV